MLKIELIKLLCQKRFYMVIFTSLAVFAAFFFLDNFNNISNQRLHRYISLKDQIIQEIDRLDCSTEIGNSEKDVFTSDYKLQHNIVSELILAAESTDWKRELLALNTMEQMDLAGNNHIPYEDILEINLQDETVNTRIAFREYLMQNEIKPSLLSGETKTIEYMLNIFHILIPFLLPTLVICICILCVYQEFSIKSIKFLLGLPIPRRKIVFSKMLVCFMTSLLLFLSLLCLSFLFSYASRGIGYPNYPIRINVNFPNEFLLGDSSFVHAKNFLFLLLLILPLNILFYLAYAFFIFECKSSSASMGITWILPIGFLLITKYTPNFLLNIIPFTVPNTYQLFTALTDISPFVSLLLLFSVTAGLIASVFIIFKKKNFISI